MIVRWESRSRGVVLRMSLTGVVNLTLPSRLETSKSGTEFRSLLVRSGMVNLVAMGRSEEGVTVITTLVLAMFPTVSLHDMGILFTPSMRFTMVMVWVLPFAVKGVVPQVQVDGSSVVRVNGVDRVPTGTVTEEAEMVMVGALVSGGGVTEGVGVGEGVVGRVVKV
ncbi:MAG: hypothetical protein US18_C0035G0009 [Parcubacteria group bacterium GW2011_GWB1_36_5]|nr:MAG: hypothetical protein US18_C0035G0009 [Parcubacteria group bacterium GW2011_GWB1_36_5]